MNKDKLFATVVTALSTIFIISIVILVFKNNINDDKAKNFVSKEGEAIAVSLASPTQSKNRDITTPKKLNHTKHKKSVKIKKHKVKEKKRAKPKVKSKPKHTVKKQKSISKPKPKVSKKRESKKVETKKLFSSISQKDALNKNSISKKKGEGKGEINKYLATIEKRLRGWPAQRNFAGEEIDVWLKIYPNGKFEYKIKKYSQNSDFNKALISYLDDLKRFGFESHKGNRAYEIEVKFIAHD